MIGSSITNLALCLGAAALASPLVVEATALDAGFLIVTTSAALLLLREHAELSRAEGAVLLLLFGLYLVLRMAG